jgi:hypothetical protein
MEHTPHASQRKAQVIEELKLYWLIVMYLWIFLGSFTMYRRLVVAETGSVYLNYGFALIEAMVIGKVILIGKMFGFSKRYENRRLIVPVLYKAVLFGLLVLLFAIVEHLVNGWIHHAGLFGGLRSIGDLGAYELGARVLMLMVALVPFFAFSEIGRVLGANKLGEMFFAERRP